MTCGLLIYLKIIRRNKQNRKFFSQNDEYKRLFSDFDSYQIIGYTCLSSELMKVTD
jgi:isopenicillin N synthase-like dioxygenase